MSPKIKTYSFKSKETIIELDMIVKKSDKKRVEKKEDKKIEKPIQKLEKKSTSVSTKKMPDLKSLFGKVKIKEKKIVDKEIVNIKKSLDPSRFKAKFEKEKKSSNIKINTVLDDKVTTTDKKRITTSKVQENDEYFSKVDELLNEFIPTTREINLIATVLVTISPNGKFDYRFIKFSKNDRFNIDLKAFLEQQKSIIYPIPKKGKTVRINVDFKSKE